jgi:hypothetical protein
VLEVYADRDRRLGVLDPTGRQLHLSVGCAVLNVSVAASGVGPAVARLPDPAQPALLASIDVGDGAVDRGLAAKGPVIGLRQTTRRRFASGEVAPEAVDALVAAAESEDAILHPVCRVPGGVDPPARPGHPTVLVDAQESVEGVAGDSADIRPSHARHGHDQIRTPVTGRCMHQRPFLIPALRPGAR